MTVWVIGNGNWFDPDKWIGSIPNGAADVADITAPQVTTLVVVDSPVTIGTLNVTGNFNNSRIAVFGDGEVTFDGIGEINTFKAPRVWFDLPVHLAVDVHFSTAHQGGDLLIEGPVSGQGRFSQGDFVPNQPNALTVVRLTGNNSFTGGYTVQFGILETIGDTALGTGALTLERGRWDGSGTIANTIRTPSFSNFSAIVSPLAGAGDLTLTGAFDLQQSDGLFQFSDGNTGQALNLAFNAVNNLANLRLGIGHNVALGSAIAADELFRVTGSGHTGIFGVLDTKGFATHINNLLFSTGEVKSSTGALDVVVDQASPQSLVGSFRGTAQSDRVQVNVSTTANFSAVDLLDWESGADHFSITGSTGADVVTGTTGDDFIAGLAGPDILSGGNGSDTADYRTSATGQVTINLLLDAASGGDATGDSLDSFENLLGSLTLRDVLIGNNLTNTLKGFGGNDSIRGEGGDDFIQGGAGSDAINGGAGTGDTASYRDSSTGQVSINLMANTFSGGEAQGDTLFFIENLEGSLTRRDILVGNNINNYLVGHGGNDSIRGEGGNDFIDGGVGADSLNAGAGIDTVSYVNSSAGVTIDLNVAAQTSGGDAAGDVLNFVENIDGSALADSITGNYQANRLVGNAGNDTMNGGTGSDYLTGGANADTFSFSDAGFGTDQIMDWEDGRDHISIALHLETSFSGLIIENNGTTDVTVKGFNGGGTIIIHSAATIILDAGDFVFT